MVSSAATGHSSSYQEAMAQHPIFKDIEVETLALLSADMRKRSYQRRHLLFLQHDPANWCYIIVSGWIKLFRETLDGDEAVVDVLNDGHLFGDSGILDHGSHDYGAEVIEDAELLCIPTVSLRRVMERDNKLVLNMLHALASQRSHHLKEIEHRTLQNAPQRVGCFLLSLCAVDQASQVLHLPYDKILISARLGMKPETFSRAVNALRKEVGIDVKGSTVTIPSIERLSDYACSACSNMFPCDEHC